MNAAAPCATATRCAARAATRRSGAAHLAHARCLERSKVAVVSSASGRISAALRRAAQPPPVR
eukprot:11197367-Lingulodinium_polyedra.AAC.1